VGAHDGQRRVEFMGDGVEEPGVGPVRLGQGLILLRQLGGGRS
jgi:hypothetical protein